MKSDISLVDGEMQYSDGSLKRCNIIIITIDINFSSVKIFGIESGPFES